MTLTKFIGIFCLWLWTSILFSQKEKLPANGDNIVPNGGFELTYESWDRWFYTGKDFGHVMKYWYSPTPTSPDVYHPVVHVPQDWAKKGFGKHSVYQGKGMAGLTLWGCKNGKPHCREFVAVQLSEPLVPGQEYVFTCYVAPLQKSLRINGIHMALSMTMPEEALEVTPPLFPIVHAPKVLLCPNEEWVRIAGRFTAKEAFEYLVIGNFDDDANTRCESIQKGSYPYAYYYLDQVVLRKVPPFRKVEIPEDDLSKLQPIVGTAFELKQILFDFDRHELHPRSYIELFKLVALMKKYPGMEISCMGHTDSIGVSNYNLKLSELRAQAVCTFLKNHGIATSRFRASGSGATQPVSDNETSEGRRKNRRVEVRVLKM